MSELVAGVVQGFSTGLGAGLANYLFMKRLENVEKRLWKRRGK